MALREGCTEVNRKSLRGRIVAYLRTTNGTATREELEERFGPKVRAALQKLQTVGWVERTEPR